MWGHSLHYTDTKNKIVSPQRTFHSKLWNKTTGLSPNKVKMIIKNNGWIILISVLWWTKQLWIDPLLQHFIPTSFYLCSKRQDYSSNHDEKYHVWYIYHKHSRQIQGSLWLNSEALEQRALCIHLTPAPATAEAGTFFGHKSPATTARDLFTPFTTSARLPVSLKKLINHLILVWCFLLVAST